MGFLEKVFGDLNAKEVKKVEKIVDQVEALDEKMAAMTDEELQAKTPEFKQRLADGETLDDLLPEAFAVAREAAWRTLGMKHFRVQLIGGVGDSGLHLGAQGVVLPAHPGHPLLHLLAQMPGLAVGLVQHPLGPAVGLQLHAGGAVLDLQEAALLYGGEKLSLSKNEFLILRILFEHKNSPVSREELIRALWNDESFIDDNTLTVNIARIRKKLEEAGLRDFIRTRKGLGYLIEEKEHD